MRHYGSQNLTQPPSSSGRVFRIKLPKPRNFAEKVEVAETYLSHYWQGRLMLEPIEEVVRTCQLMVHQRLLSRIQADREVPERRRLIKQVAALLAWGVDDLRFRKQIREFLRRRDLRWIDLEVVRLRGLREQTERDEAERVRLAEIERVRAEQERVRLEREEFNRRQAEKTRAQKEAEQRQREREAEAQRKQWEDFTRMLFGEPPKDLTPHYRTLGISPGAPKDQVKSAYRKLAMQTHPDQCAFTGLDVATANERFRAVNEAYRALIV